MNRYIDIVKPGYRYEGNHAPEDIMHDKYWKQESRISLHFFSWMTTIWFSKSELIEMHKEVVERLNKEML